MTPPPLYRTSDVYEARLLVQLIRQDAETAIVRLTAATPRGPVTRFAAFSAGARVPGELHDLAAARRALGGAGV